MANVSSTSLTVTIVTLTPDAGDDEYILEAEIDSDDNNGESTYYVGESYKFRLYKSSNISTVTYNASQGSVSLGGTSTEARPKTGEKEYLTFSGSREGSLDKILESGFSSSAVGSIFDKNGNSSGASLTPVVGSKKVIASQEIFAVFEVSYTTKYTVGTFSGSYAGPMLIFFIGTGS